VVNNYHGQRLDSVDSFRENSIKGAQEVDINTYRLEVSGLVESPKSYTYSEVLAHASIQKVVTLNCVEGWSATVLWTGVRVTDLLDETGPMPEANTVIFRAVDGYSTSLPLSYVRDKNIILASSINNATLTPAKGFPFQLVAEDKWGYKWIKWVKSIELSSNASYRGYWEGRGFNNLGDLHGPKLEQG